MLAVGLSNRNTDSRCRAKVRVRCCRCDRASGIGDRGSGGGGRGAGVGGRGSGVGGRPAWAGRREGWARSRLRWFALRWCRWARVSGSFATNGGADFGTRRLFEKEVLHEQRRRVHARGVWGRSLDDGDLPDAPGRCGVGGGGDRGRQRRNWTIARSPRRLGVDPGGDCPLFRRVAAELSGPSPGTGLQRRDCARPRRNRLATRGAVVGLRASHGTCGAGASGDAG